MAVAVTVAYGGDSSPHGGCGSGGGYVIWRWLWQWHMEVAVVHITF